ncbi:TetR/AcrR family transcriptional regulator [Cryptosporangium phraense]|uniref:TetR/AcrR family transcriptional regulator n=1 Tax=Cryptosporangium phraense TaxID=2593070 RepID=A0A545AIF8_9ACTN|nr:TetR/AcrR family transcriptional regulator [Cryptosporangium phraense]TQS41106.1 TetR/AcrR family transcriptional regulator [Cryptosporangium phraense]
MTVTETELRTAMIAAAEQQLASSAGRDIATRAVCEAVGVSQPVLYRLFGDKRGLLDAVADAGFERYAALKAAQPATGDPVADLRAGWDQHMAFARENPALYQLMFAPRPQAHSGARARVFGLLEAQLVRCAAAGALTVAPGVAAQLILSANVGVALNLIAQPELFDSASLSGQMRDTVFGAVLTTAAAPAEPDPVSAAALRLRSQLRVAGTPALEPAEATLLEVWLDRIAGTVRRGR